MRPVTYLYTERQAQPHPGAAKVALEPHAAAELDQAELFLLELAELTRDVDLPRMAYLLGLAEGHLANTVQHLRAVTR
jgi:hypothetical protein